MEKQILSEITRIKSLFKEERLYGNIITEQELPGPNYYEIQKFIEKHTGINTGAPGFGDMTAKALGVYLMGDNNTINSVEDLSKVLSDFGFETNGDEFGIDYAKAVSNIIKFVEGKTEDIVEILSTRENKDLIINLINTAVNNQLPFDDKTKLGEFLPVKSPVNVDFVKTIWNKLRNIDIKYGIDEIIFKDYNLKDGTINVGISGNLNIGGFVSFIVYGNGTVSIEIVDDRYVYTKIESVNLSTKYQYIDDLFDVGFQLKDNYVRLLFAQNRFPDIGIFGIGEGHTEWGPYYYTTPIEEEIKAIPIEPIDLEPYKKDFKTNVVKNL